MRTSEIHSLKKPNRSFIPYSSLEDTKAGVWRIASKEDREKFLPLAGELMKHPQEFLDAMRRAINEWPLTSNFHLSNPSINKQAWIGHAGCCIALGSPEEVTRLAWHTLSTEEQNTANQMADKAIQGWEDRLDKNDLCQRNLWI